MMSSSDALARPIRCFHDRRTPSQLPDVCSSLANFGVSVSNPSFHRMFCRVHFLKTHRIASGEEVVPTRGGRLHQTRIARLALTRLETIRFCGTLVQVPSRRGVAHASLFVRPGHVSASSNTPPSSTPRKGPGAPPPRSTPKSNVRKNFAKSGGEEGTVSEARRQHAHEERRLHPYSDSCQGMCALFQRTQAVRLIQTPDIVEAHLAFSAAELRHRRTTRLCKGEVHRCEKGVWCRQPSS